MKDVIRPNQREARRFCRAFCFFHLVSAEDDMPNWWLIWAEHLARALAAWWLRVPEGGGGAPRPEPDEPDLPDDESESAADGS